jgi:hypothetical protein
MKLVLGSVSPMKLFSGLRAASLDEVYQLEELP